MTLHLIKLCAGADSVADLEGRIARGVAANKKAGEGAVHTHVTRMFPRRREEILNGGSIYWVIRGVVLVRQKILDLELRAGADGIERCAIMLDPPLVPTEAQSRRAFQGWRYLKEEDAPRDIASKAAAASTELQLALAELGLL